MRIAIYTLGCKVNQYETQAMEQELTRRGHEIVPVSYTHLWPKLPSRRSCKAILSC